jgi:hypothetical protein
LLNRNKFLILGLIRRFLKKFCYLSKFLLNFINKRSKHHKVRPYNRNKEFVPIAPAATTPGSNLPNSASIPQPLINRPNSNINNEAFSPNLTSPTQLNGNNNSRPNPNPTAQNQSINQQPNNNNNGNSVNVNNQSQPNIQNLLFMNQQQQRPGSSNQFQIENGTNNQAMTNQNNQILPLKQNVSLNDTAQQPPPPPPFLPPPPPAPNKIPRTAVLSLQNAPLHLDVGGYLYTSSLETLINSKSSNNCSKLSKMFDGTLPIVYDSMKQRYFIDRDGKLFRHVLNFMRTNCLNLSNNFEDHAALLCEAEYYEIEAMCKELRQIIESKTPINNEPKNENENNRTAQQATKSADRIKFITLSYFENNKSIEITSNEADVLKALFPNLSQNLSSDAKKLCLNQSNMHLVQLIELLYNNGYVLERCITQQQENSQPEQQIPTTKYVFVNKS